MKNAITAKYFSIIGIILILISALIQTGGDGTSIIVVLISLLLLIASYIKVAKIVKK